MLKTKTITTDKATLLVCELPKGITEVTNTGKRLAIPDRKGGHHFVYGNWQLIGRLPDITEEQAKLILPDYHTERLYATESIYDLLKANEVYFENPYRDPGLIPSAELNVYRKAQQNVFDINRTYLYIKVD